jgi:predicted phosphodiesterase
MRYLIISDIHANWEGLQAVLRDARNSYDRILCAGDLVGYGADPNAVVDWARREISAVVRGNHDKACCGLLDDLEWFNPVARQAALWTRAQLTYANLEYLQNLPKGPIRVENFQLLHGSPLDEDEYLLASSDAIFLAPQLKYRLSFFGHTHVQGGFLIHRGGVEVLGGPVSGKNRTLCALEPETIYLSNPGSVGQPRDGDPRAAYLIYDTKENTVSYQRVGYDISSAQAKIISAGLPEILARRLAIGV